MTTYVVASKSGQPYLAECQVLGEFLQVNSPDLCVKYVIKDNTEWAQFIDSVCRSYGFKSKSCPIIYTLEGTFIGDGRAFVEHVRERYGKTLNIPKDVTKSRMRMNIEENELRMRKNREGETMGEQIMNYLNTLRQKRLALLIDDAFYEQTNEKGIFFYLRKHNNLRDIKFLRQIEDGKKSKKQKSKKDQEKDKEKENDKLIETNQSQIILENEEIQQNISKDEIENELITQQEKSEYLNLNKTKNIPDEDLQILIEQQQLAQIEAQRDKTFEEFTQQYMDHILGKIDPQIRVGNRPPTAVVDDVTSQRAGAKTGMSHNKSQAHTEDDKSSNRKRTMKITSQMNQRDKTEDGKESEFQSENSDYKYDLSQDCKLEILTLNKIVSFDDNFVLVAHPFPQIEGEMLLFQITEESNDPNLIAFRDYSLKKRLISPEKPEKLSALFKKKFAEDDPVKTRIQSLEIDLEWALSTVDWTYFSYVINEIQAMGWLQYLPSSQKSSSPLQFNVLHILPSSKIPFPKVPLDLFLSTKMTFKKKEDKKIQIVGSKNKEEVLKQNTPVHQNEREATEKGLVLIDEYQFEHAICPLSADELNPEGLKLAYKKLYIFLQLRQKKDAGITLIVTPQWMFLGLINQPYHYEKLMDIPGKELENGIPVYLDGFAYSGIFNIQPIIKKWPQTASSQDKQHTLLDAIHTQSKPSQELVNYVFE